MVQRLQDTHRQVLDNYHNSTKFNIINLFLVVTSSQVSLHSLASLKKPSNFGTKEMRNFEDFHFLHPLFLKESSKSKGMLPIPHMSQIKAFSSFLCHGEQGQNLHLWLSGHFRNPAESASKKPAFPKPWISLTVIELILCSASPLPHAKQYQFKCCHPSFSLPTIQLFHISRDWGSPPQIYYFI